MSLVAIGPTLDSHLPITIALLVLLTVGVALVGRLGTIVASLSASARAIVQLLVVAGIIGVVLARTWSSIAFAGAMLVVATATASNRVDARRSWPWVAASLLAGSAPVLLVIFLSRGAPFEPEVIVPVSGIMIGGSMTAFALAVRRAIAELREHGGHVEAALALGFRRPQAIALAIDRMRPEALVPALDQTRTVGLVTLPGAFVGVLLGGGSAGDAAATQLVVLIGLLAAQTTTVVVSSRLVAAGLILPPDVEAGLPTS